MPDDSPLQEGVESSPCLQHDMDTHNTATPCPDDYSQNATAEDEEDFSTAPLDNDVWLEEPVPDRHFCIHEQSQPYDQCPYPCPYSLDQLQSAPEDA